MLNPLPVVSQSPSAVISVLVLFIRFNQIHSVSIGLFVRAQYESIANMDGEKGAEIDGFSRFLPLPYRVAIILVAGEQTQTKLTSD